MIERLSASALAVKPCSHRNRSLAMPAVLKQTLVMIASGKRLSDIAGELSLSPKSGFDVLRPDP